MPLRITIEKTVENERPTQFVVTVFGHLEGDDRTALGTYGAPPLDALLDPDEYTKFFSKDGVQEAFTNLRDAEDLISQFKAACDATNAYWRDAATFSGTETYPRGAERSESASFGTW